MPRSLPFIVALIVSLVPLPAFAQYQQVPQITLTGRGEATLAPDIATIVVGIVTQKENPQDSLEENSKQLTRAIEALKKAGIESKDLQTGNLSLQPQSRDIGSIPQIVAFRVDNSLIITVRDLSKLGALLKTVVNLGVNSIQGPSFASSNPAETQNKARYAAMEDAKKKAMLYVKGMDVKLGKIIQISENYSNPMPVSSSLDSFSRADRTNVPIEAGSVRYESQVTVVWEILP